MDELRHRAGEKIEALHVAAKTVADNGKSKVHNVVSTTTETIRKIREIFHELWNNELIAESRVRAGAWAREAVRRVREGAPPLSPLLLYEELRALFHDRVWRRSVVIFVCGAAVGAGAGAALGLRLGARAPSGPHARALHTHADQSVILVDDAVAHSVGPGEVLIRVQAFTVCACDRAVLRGRGRALRGLCARGPVSLGRSFAGVVLDVGWGVSDLELGDEVWGCVSEWGGGAATELLTIRSTRVSKRPRGIGADGAAALPWAATTALSACDRLGYTTYNVKGKRVAVCGAASPAGCALVQLLARGGALLTVLAPHHAAMTLRDLGAQEFLDPTAEKKPWSTVIEHAAHSGPWDAFVACASAEPHVSLPAACLVLKATAPRKALLDLRFKPLLSDRLVAPFSFLFAVSFYTYRVLRWASGCGTHTDWLEEARLRDALDRARDMVEAGHLAPIVDKVYLPQDFENALAHACSDDAVGATVIRFP